MFDIHVDSSFLIKWIPIISSISALLISLYTLWKNRTRITVTFQPDLEVIEAESMEFHGLEIPIKPYESGLIGKLEIVNYSPNDLGFFDLRAFNPDTNINLLLLTQRAIHPDLRNLKPFRSIKLQDGRDTLEDLILPEANYGVLKAHSFNRFHLFIPASIETEKIIISFKVTKRGILRDRYAVTNRKRFKVYGRSYNTKDWEKLIQQPKQ